MSNDHFIVTVHALERFEERFPEEWKGDEEAGLLIYDEVMDALDNRRVSSIPPIELSDYDPEKWRAQKSRIAWTADKTRGFVLVESEEGMAVATILVGRPADEARRTIYPQKARSR